MTSLHSLAAPPAPRVQVSGRASDARALLARFPEAGPDLPACHGDRLVGVVPVERLLAARDDAPLASLIDEPTVVVASATEPADAAWQAAIQGARSVAVVDEAGRFLRMLPPERLIGVLSEEHAEDLARLGGFLAQTGSARTASEESVRRRLWHRLPWLAIGLLGAMASAGIVASFEAELERVVLLAFFVPAVVYMADAVGTQTVTVVIRGMALGVSLRTIVVRELSTGLVIGVLLSGAFFSFALAVFVGQRAEQRAALRPVRLEQWLDELGPHVRQPVEATPQALLRESAEEVEECVAVLAARRAQAERPSVAEDDVDRVAGGGSHGANHYRSADATRK